MYTFAILLTIASSALYHVAQKLIPRASNPVLTLLLTYLVAALICLFLLIFFPVSGTLAKSIREMNWSAIGLAFAIVGLEVGFLLAYRAGWNISLGAIVANVAVTLILVPVGLIFFKERLTGINYLGVVVCIFGLVLANWR